ncbi:MAG: hypothetical protein KKE17_06225 [Proteobacteria bacterium]|nr:hypothetical protein [Pseudomonadota bacterium]MBU1709584.1 hypothetical protein [Pseudomonadota bacterium]
MFLRFLAVTLCSSVFFFASCTASFVVGVNILTSMDECDIAAGDAPPDFFTVLAQSPYEKLPLRVTFADMETFKEMKEHYSFLLAEPEGELVYSDLLRVEFSAENISPEEQMITLNYFGDDFSAVMKYRATDKQVIPVYSKLFQPSNILIALPLAFGIAYSMRFFGKSIKRKTEETPGDGQ